MEWNRGKVDEKKRKMRRDVVAIHHEQILQRGEAVCVDLELANSYRSSIHIGSCY